MVLKESQLWDFYILLTLTLVLVRSSLVIQAILAEELLLRSREVILPLYSAPLWRDLTWSPASSSGISSTGKTWTCWSGARGSHKND